MVESDRQEAEAANMDTLIKEGTLVSPQGSFLADLRISGSSIAAIGQDLPAAGANVISAAGCLVFPGFIDPHTHFDLDNGVTRSPDDFASGTKAALLGGTTTILDFANQNRGEDLEAALAEWHRKASDRSACDYGFHMAITDWNPLIAKEIVKMRERGVSSFKLYMAYDNLRVHDGLLYTIMKQIREIGGIIGVHCENGDLVNAMVAEQRAKGNRGPEGHPLSRPAEVEAEAVGRCLHIASLAGTAVNIVHLSTAAGMMEVMHARARGQTVYVETCPQYLLLDDSKYRMPDFEGAKYVMSPPLRKLDDQEVLWQALAADAVNSIGTDHCSFNFLGQKDLGRQDFSKIPNGIPGVEHRPALIYTYGVAAGRISTEQMAALLSENVARIFGMFPQKGTLLAGSDADVVIWDPAVSGTITAREQMQQVDYTPYEGFAVRGMARDVFLRGRHVVQQGRLLETSLGRYVHRGPSGRLG